MIKKLLIFLVILSITIPYADAVPLSDKTGLKFTFPVKTDGYTFTVEATGNLDVTNLDFDKDKKSITLFILSSLENNSLEISFPNQLIGLDAGADVILQKPVSMVQFRIQLQVARRIMEHQMRQRVLQENLWNQANQDALTNIPNRRAILRSLERNGATCAQREQPLGVLMIDLDYFKQINDTFGHDGGDAVLREVAERMKAGIRTTDTIGRFGGEEFLAVIPNCAGEELLRIAERIRSSVNRPVQTEDQLIPVSCSIGLAVRWDKNDGDIQEALQRADKALYVAKEMGRNRVVSAWTLNNRSKKLG